MDSTTTADKGFNIGNDRLSYNLSLYTPPEKWKYTKQFHLNLLRQNKFQIHAHQLKELLDKLKLSKYLPMNAY